MIIRPATAADLPACLVMGRQFFARTAYAQFGLNDDDMREIGQLMIEDDGGALLVAEDGGQLVGMVGMVLAPLYMNRAVKMAQEMFWWSEAPGAGSALLKAAEAWAESVGAQMMLMISLDSVDGERVSKMYTRRGYEGGERYHHKVLSWQ